MVPALDDNSTHADRSGSENADLAPGARPAPDDAAGRLQRLAPDLDLAGRAFAASVVRLGLQPECLAWAKPVTDPHALVLLIVSTWVDTLGEGVVRPPLEKARSLVRWPDAPPAIVLRPAYADAALALRKTFVERAGQAREGCVADEWIAFGDEPFQTRLSWIVGCRRAHARGPDDRRRFGVFCDRLAREGGMI